MKEFTKQMRQKGWLSKEVAKLWGMTPRGLSKIAANPKPIHWSALAGLPGRKLTQTKGD